MKLFIPKRKDEKTQVAVQYIHLSGDNSFELSKDIAIYEIQAPQAMYGYTSNNLQIQQRYNVKLLRIKRN